MKVLVTGGAGYIGSHTSVSLCESGYDVAIFDNLCNSGKEAVLRAQKLCGKKITFIKGDIRSKSDLQSAFESAKPDCVIHFAGLKAVGESIEIPLEYYENNVCGTINLLQVMEEFSVKKFVFSSSATVYKSTNPMPLTEDMEIGATNPYGYTKVMIEQILRDFYVAHNDFSVGILRYFNPIGAHPSGLIGEKPKGIPNNLMPYITQVAFGKLEKLRVFGNDYPTKDGSCIRDYIHVCDLAEGHVSMLKKLEGSQGIFTYNLGTGKGTSVFEIIDIFEKATGIAVPYEIAPQRAGDNAVCYADCSLAKTELGWTAKRNIFDMCRDSFNWQKLNPNGYENS